MITIELEDGKYTVTYEAGKLQALRYGEPWRDLTGDNMVAALVTEIERLRGRGAAMSTEYELHTKGAQHSFEPTDSAGYTLGPVSDGGLDPRDRQAEPVKVSSVPAGLPEILREAAAIITAIPREHAPQNIRWPIADELEGFASIIEDNQPNQGKE